MVRTLDGLDLGVRAQLHVRRAEERRAGVPARYSEDDVVHLVLDEGPRNHDADVAVEILVLRNGDTTASVDTCRDIGIGRRAGSRLGIVLLLLVVRLPLDCL